MKHFPNDHGFTRAELRLFGALKTPVRIQEFIETVAYHRNDTAWSPRRVLKEGAAHCMEGALLAATALRVNGYPPLVFDMEASQDDDHVVAVFKERGRWGAIAKSNFTGLRYRDPVYRSLRELAMSYFDVYCNLRRERTLRTYSRAVDLSRFDDRDWMTTLKSVWYIPEYLCEIKHDPLITRAMANHLTRLDSRTFAGERVGMKKH